MVHIPQFPASERDWTLPLPLSLLMDPVMAAIRKSSPPLLEKVELIDLYQPEEAKEKHATFRFTYRDLLKTVSHEEVEIAHDRLMQNVSKLLAKSQSVT